MKSVRAAKDVVFGMVEEYIDVVGKLGAGMTE
jgi:hypothetical protein